MTESLEEEFSGLLASILSVEQQYKPATESPLSDTLTSKETKRVLDSRSPDELLSCVLTQLNAREHQMGSLCLLENVARRKQVGDAPLSPLATELSGLACEFLSSCRGTDYVSTSKLWSQRLCFLCVVIARSAIAAASDGRSGMASAEACILPLCNGLDCITQSNYQRITPLHGPLLALCATTKCYAKAVTLIGPMPSVYDPKRFGTTLNDVLKYFLHGADIFLALQRYEEAMGLLTGAVVMPLFTPKAAATSALKKYVLTSLLLDGELRELPSYAPGIMKRALAQDIPEYAGLVELAKNLRFERDSVESGRELQSYITEKKHVWASDGNSSLIGAIADELHARLVLKRCAKTYTRVPKDVLMEYLGLASEADLYRVILKFTGANQLCARIDDEQGVVHFQHHSSVDTIPSMPEIMELIQQTTDARNAVDEDWIDIQTSELFRKAAMVGQGDAVRKKGMADPAR